jgi:Nickel responsive protein SCO4226-like
MPETSSRFIAECFWVGVRQEDLRALDARVETCLVGMAALSVRYLGSMLMPEDEVVLCFFEGSAAEVREVAKRAEVPFERILESDGTAWPGIKPPRPSRRSKAR